MKEELSALPRQAHILLPDRKGRFKRDNYLPHLPPFLVPQDFFLPQAITKKFKDLILILST